MPTSIAIIQRTSIRFPLKFERANPSRGGDAKSWVSQAERLKPHAIDVKSPVDPIHWFLDGKEDVRSSYYLEDVVTEFDVQGLELDWACVTWDADFRYTNNGWQHFSFVGDRWNRVKKLERQNYLKNAYRVLLTRARQGMVMLFRLGMIMIQHEVKIITIQLLRIYRK